MKEHIITMVYLGLLFTLFNSPFPNRLLESDGILQEDQINLPEKNHETAPSSFEEIDLEVDSFDENTPAVAAYIDIS